MGFGLKRERWAALAGAILSMIAFPVMLQQGYFRTNPYILPTLAVVSVLLYLVFFLTGRGIRSRVVAFRLGFGKRHPMLGFLMAVTVGAALGAALGAGWWIALGKSREHLAALPDKDVSVIPMRLPPTSTPFTSEQVRQSLADFRAAIRHLRDVAMIHGTQAELHAAHGREAGARDGLLAFLPPVDRQWLMERTKEIEELADDIWKIGSVVPEAPMPAPYAEFNSKVATLQEELFSKFFPSSAETTSALATASPTATDQQNLDAAIASAKDAPPPKDAAEDAPLILADGVVRSPLRQETLGTIGLKLTNHGKGVAFSVKARGWFYPRPSESPMLPDKLERPPIETPGGTATLASGGSIDLIVSLKPEQMGVLDDARAGKVVLYFDGYCDYVDRLEKPHQPHRTSFCFFYDHKTGLWNLCERHNEPEY